MEDIIAKSMLGCQSTKAAFEIQCNREKIKEMIKLAIDSRHESVLEHSSFTFSVKGVSRTCTHQLVRHRIASYSQQSQRHVDPTRTSDYYVVPDTILNHISPNQLHVILTEYEELMERISEFYGKMVKEGIPKEDARFVFPNACKTNIVITMNVRELRHFFRLRRAKEAQWEIRAMANKMYKEVYRRFPNLFDKYRKAV